MPPVPIKKNCKPIQYIDRGSKHLLVYFCSLNARPEYFKTFEKLNWSVLYLCDPYVSWFSWGFDSLLPLVAKQMIRPTYFAGSSMGGYAALLFAAMLKPEGVLAFAPQTDLAVGRTKDFQKQIKPNWGHLDLLPIMKATDYSTPTQIVSCKKETINPKWEDQYQIQRIAKVFPHIQWNVRNCVDHGIGAYLKQTKQMIPIFKELIKNIENPNT